MKRSTGLIAALGVVALAGALTACTGEAAPTAEPTEAPTAAPIPAVPATVAMHFNVPQSSWISILTAEDQGLFEGVEPELQYLGSTALAIQSVVAGNSDIGIAAPGAVLSAIQEGAPLVIVSNHIQNDPTGVIVQGSAATWSDLAGLTISTTETTAERPLFMAMLEREGLEDQVEIVYVDQQTKCAVMFNGTVDACTGFSYADYSTGILQGLDLSFIPFSTDETPYPGPVIFTTKDYLATNGEVVTAFLAGVVDGALAAEADTPRAIELMKQLDPASLPANLERAVPTIIELMHSERTAQNGFGWMTDDVFQNLIDALVSGGVLAGDPGASNVYTNDYQPGNASEWR